jgi:arylsulfatase A-like enzyme
VDSKQLPNIIYIFSDEHRGQAMSHMGDENVKTPVMDRLAREGVSFSRAYANCPVCTPSRGTVFSGRHAHCGPVSTFTETWKAAFPSTAHCMRKLGYHTAHYGKWHCGLTTDQVSEQSRETPLGHPSRRCTRTPERHRAGFQDWFASEYGGELWEPYYYRNNEIEPVKLEGYDTDVLTDETIKYIEEYDRDDPLFMVMSPLAPHFPLDADEKWKRWDPEKLKVRKNFRESILEKEPALRERLANYYAMIENLDWNIGRLVEAVQNTKGFENTLIIYFSDHGDFAGSHGMGFTKLHPQEESISIPAIFHWPGVIPETGNNDNMFSLVDLQATVLGLVGQEKPSCDQGTDYSPELMGRGFDAPEYVLLEMSGPPHNNLMHTEWRGITSKEWKYAMYENRDEVLFDLVNDPYEMTNLAAAMPEKTAEMRKVLVEELRKTNEPFFDIIIEQGIAPDKADINVSLDPIFDGVLQHFFPAEEEGINPAERQGG